MNSLPRVLLALVTASFSAAAATLYVDLENQTPFPPYASWGTAATTIQDAVDASVAGDEIVVADGVYATGGRIEGDPPTNRVVLDKAVLVRSLNGPASTVIQGYQVPGTTNGDAAIRCVFMTNAALLSGFTLTGGATATNYSAGYWTQPSGGGVWCASTQEVLTNCVLTSNSAFRNGGAAYQGTFDNCNICSNSIGDINGEGGGCCNSILINCSVLYNSGPNGGGTAGGALTNCILQGNAISGGSDGALLFNCLVVSNTCDRGIAAGLMGGAAINCIFVGNYARDQMASGATDSSRLRNCLILSNHAERGVGGVHGSDIVNCTIVGNSSAWGMGGIAGLATNCIVYFNYGSAGVSNFSSSNPSLEHCCTFPLPLRQSATVTNEPLFVDSASGDFRLRSDSPCINVGLNAVIGVSTDLDGNPRIVGGSVDIGAYEFQVSAGTFRISDVSANHSDVTIAWDSQFGRNYYVECSTNLAAQSSFFCVGTNIAGQMNMTTFTHSNALASPGRFYRVGVRAP